MFLGHTKLIKSYIWKLLNPLVIIWSALSCFFPASHFACICLLSLVIHAYFKLFRREFTFLLCVNNYLNGILIHDFGFWMVSQPECSVRFHEWLTAHSCPWKVKVSTYGCSFHKANRTIGSCELDSSDD